MSATLTAWLTVALGQVGGDAAGAPGAGDSAKVQSVWDFMIKGGPMMIPILLCSLVALTVIVERLLSLRRRRIIPANFLPGLTKIIDQDNADSQRALDHCRINESSIANIFAALVKRLGQPVEVIEKHVADAGEREVFKLRKYLRVLSVIAAIGPLLGLLGTIFGMIIAFQTVATSGQALGKAELLAEGIYQAMITTAAGLMVAIPSLIAYHWLSAKIEHLVVEMNNMTVDFIDEYAGPRQPPPSLSSGAVSITPTEQPADSAGGKAKTPVMAG